MLMEASILGHLPTKFGHNQMQGWKVINRYRILQVNFHIWPLTYLCDLWPQNIMEANIGHLPTKFGYKQMQGWKVIQVFVSVTDGRRTDGRTQFGSLVSPPLQWARQKCTFILLKHFLEQVDYLCECCRCELTCKLHLVAGPSYQQAIKDYT